MRRWLIGSWICGTILLMTLVTGIPDALGIPAFARKYRMSCSTCHAPVPRLKAYGDDFAGNAFKLEDREPVRAFFDTGDDLLTLQRELPVAVRFDSYLRFQTKELGRRSDVQTPYYLKFLSGGQIAGNVGYYFYFFFSERGEVAGVEDAYLHFNNLFGHDLDLMIGQFQVSDPLFKRELRITLEDYPIYKVKVGQTPSNLTYDRGVMLTYGTDVGFDAVLEVVNGNGIGPANEAHIFDSDDNKNFALRLSQQIGALRVGAFGYRGKATVLGSDNTFRYLGADVTLDVGTTLQLNVQYLERRDDNPFFLRSKPRKTTVRGGFVEAIWAVDGEAGRPWLTFLYNWVDSPAELRALRYESATLSFSYLMRRNLRLVAEVTRDLDLKATRAALGFVSAF